MYSVLFQEFTAQLSLEQCQQLICEAYCSKGGLQLARSILGNDPTPHDPPPPEPAQQSNSVPWCRCTKCQNMPLPMENVCCRQRCCITTLEFFETSMLDINVLTIAIHSRCDDYGDDPLFTPAEYRKAAYRQYIIWQHTYLGRGNRKVILSCVVWAIRNRYPAPDGQYLGFKEY